MIPIVVLYHSQVLDGHLPPVWRLCGPAWWPWYRCVESWLAVNFWVDFHLGHWVTTFQQTTGCIFRIYSFCLLPASKRSHDFVLDQFVCMSLFVSRILFEKLWTNIHKFFGKSWHWERSNRLDFLYDRDLDRTQESLSPILICEVALFIRYFISRCQQHRSNADGFNNEPDFKNLS